MRFEFDAEKSAKTKADPNRRIDFIEAQQIWADHERVEIPLLFTSEPPVGGDWQNERQVMDGHHNQTRGSNSYNFRA